MYKKKIRTQIIFYLVLTLGITLALQIVLYSILRCRNNKNISAVFESIAQNTVSQIDTLNEEIADLSARLSTHSYVQNSLYKYNHSEFVKYMKKTQELLDDYLARNHNIVYLGIIKENDLLMSSETMALYSQVRSMLQAMDIDPRDSSPIYPPSFIDDNNRTLFSCITPVFPIDVTYYTSEHKKNYIVCLYEMNTISYTPYKFIDNSTISLQITDAQDRILLSADPALHGKTNHTNTKARNIFSKTMPLSSVDWNVTIFTPLSSAKGFTDISLLFILFMVATNVIILFTMLKLLSGIIIKRISHLSSAVKKIPHNSTEYRVDYPYCDEFLEIAQMINLSLDKIYDLNQEKYETAEKLHHAELLQKETQLIYLSGQVSPHFLYNSMAHIQGLAMQNRSQEIAQMTVSMAKVFRYFSNNSPFSTIKQDLDCAVDYFNIINSRRYKQLTIQYEIDPELYYIPCLKMLYQPVMENILKHAFRYDETGTVTISSIPDDKKAIIEISDTGKGFSSDILAVLTKKLTHNEKSGEIIIPNSDHVGLLNIDLRLKLYYGNGNGIKITSGPNAPATVQIIFDKERPDKEYMLSHLSM